MNSQETLQEQVNVDLQRARSKDERNAAGVVEVSPAE